ncbi:MAG: hypothetical protein ACFE8B_12045 [Candidatus Hermodarchaeota archaeon]
MSEQEISDVESSEFVKAIKEGYESLNTNEKFKEQFRDINFKLLLNPTDRDFAALITVDKGIVSVEGIKNTPKEKISKEVLGWDSYVKTTRQTFKEIGDGTLSSSDIRKKVLTRKIKVKGLKYLVSFGKMSALRRGE